MKPNILLIDIETLPNLGYFFDIYSDRGIPLQFVKKPKSICTIGYKFLDDKEVTVLSADRPYDDKRILKALSSVWERADYIVGHFIDGFDVPFISGRLIANGLPPLAVVPSIDTYKLAKKYFGKTLNSNKLDNLGTVLGVGNKHKTDATLWVRCAEGDKDAMEVMSAYNAEDVYLLERVLLKMLPYTPSKLNYNLFNDEAEISCQTCGSHKVQRRGTVVTKLTKRTRIHCQSCGAWSTIKYEEEEKPKVSEKRKGVKINKKRLTP